PSAVDLARFRRRQLLRIVLRDVLGVATLSDVVEELSNLADAILSVAYVRLLRDFAGQAGGQRAELQLRYRPDVRAWRRWRDRRRGEPDQQGVLQESRQPVHFPALHLYRGGPVLPRGSPPAPRRHAGGDLDFRRRGQDVLRTARARLGKADADQGADFGRRARAGRRIAGVRG